MEERTKRLLKGCVILLLWVTSVFAGVFLASRILYPPPVPPEDGFIPASQHYVHLPAIDGQTLEPIAFMVSVFAHNGDALELAVIGVNGTAVLLREYHPYDAVVFQVESPGYYTVTQERMLPPDFTRSPLCPRPEYEHNITLDAVFLNRICQNISATATYHLLGSPDGVTLQLRNYDNDTVYGCGEVHNMISGQYYVGPVLVIRAPVNSGCLLTVYEGFGHIKPVREWFAGDVDLGWYYIYQLEPLASHWGEIPLGALYGWYVHSTTQENYTLSWALYDTLPPDVFDTPWFLHLGGVNGTIEVTKSMLEEVIH